MNVRAQQFRHGLVDQLVPLTEATVSAAGALAAAGALPLGWHTARLIASPESKKIFRSFM